LKKSLRVIELTLIISKIKNIEQSHILLQAILENSLGRDNLRIAIKNNYFDTKGKAITHSEHTPYPHQDWQKK
jgi:flagellum-specific peptidoglycan hydrolase FlgJ